MLGIYIPVKAGSHPQKLQMKRNGRSPETCSGLRELATQYRVCLFIQKWNTKMDTAIVTMLRDFGHLPNQIGG
jgi:hypothetical protein